jgi:hypothetical protein
MDFDFFFQLYSIQKTMFIVIKWKKLTNIKSANYQLFTVTLLF